MCQERFHQNIEEKGEAKFCFHFVKKILCLVQTNTDTSSFTTFCLGFAIVFDG